MLTLPRIAMGAVLALVAVAAIAAGSWWFFVREDNDLATSAPAIPDDLRNTPAAGATAGTTPDAADSGGRGFVILPERSEAAYFADEKLASLPLPSTAKGSTKHIEGTFYLTADGLDLDASQPSAFTVDLTTLESGEDRRDNRVQNDALQTSQFPTATFTATSVSGYDASISTGQEQSLLLTGMMDLHGVRREITWEVKARREADLITALATVTFPYADFNITPPNIAGFVSVEDDVTLQVQIVAQAS